MKYVKLERERERESSKLASKFKRTKVDSRAKLTQRLHHIPSFPVPTLPLYIHSLFIIVDENFSLLDDSYLLSRVYSLLYSTTNTQQAPLDEYY